MKHCDFSYYIWRETMLQEAEQFAAKVQYRHWLVDNDCTPIVPTYWHGRARASNPGFPTYHSRLGRVSIPENE